MGHGQPAAVEHVVAHQAGDELADPVAEVFGRCTQLFDTAIQAMGQLDLAALQPAVELALVIAQHAQRHAILDHGHDQPQRVRDPWAAIDEITHEHRLAAGGRGDPPAGLAVPLHGLDAVAEAAEQRFELVRTAMDVADDVERSPLVAPIGPQPLPHDLGTIHGFLRVELVDMAEALAAQRAHAAPQGHGLVADDMRAEGAVGAALVAGAADLLAGVHDDGHGQGMPTPRHLQQPGAVLGADIGRVDHGEAPGLEPQVQDGVDEAECLGRGPLVVLVVGDEPAADVGRDDLGRLEMPPGKGRLAGARRTDQQHQGKFGDGDPHRVNTASWVGAPSSACSSPTLSNRTA